MLGGEPIHRDEVEPEVAFQVFELRSEIHRLLVREAEALADRRLLEAEAERRGLPVEALLAAEVDDTPVSEAEIDA